MARSIKWLDRKLKERRTGALRRRRNDFEMWHLTLKDALSKPRVLEAEIANIEDKIAKAEHDINNLTRKLNLGAIHSERRQA